MICSHLHIMIEKFSKKMNRIKWYWLNHFDVSYPNHVFIILFLDIIFPNQLDAMHLYWLLDVDSYIKFLHAYYSQIIIVNSKFFIAPYYHCYARHLKFHNIKVLDQHPLPQGYI